MIYNRITGEYRYEEYDDSDLALVKRSELEQSLGTEYEVVVLSAQNIDELRVTHGRFFRLDSKTDGQLDISQLA